MTASETQVGRWRMGTVRPEMSVRADTDPAALLDVLAGGFLSAGMRVLDRTDAGFRTVHHPWKQWLMLNPSFRMQLQVRATGDGALITAISTGSGSRSSAYAARGLNSAIAELRRTGIGVSWSPWRDLARP